MDEHNKETKKDAQTGIYIGVVAGVAALIVAGFAIYKAHYDTKDLTDFIEKNESETLKFITETKDGIKEFITKTRYLQEGSIYFNTEDWKNAIKYYNHYLESEPNDIRVLNNKGASLSHLERWVDAIPIFQRIIDTESHDKEVKAAAYNNIGLCYTELKNFPESLKAFETGLNLQPNHPDTLLSIGYHYLDKMIDPKKALYYYDKIIDQNLYDKKELADVFANKAKAYFLLEEYDKSIDAANHALTLDDKHVKALLQKSNALFKLHEYGNAILCVDNILKIDPSFDIGLITKANALMELGLLKESVITTNSYLQRHPDDSVAYTNIGMIFGRFGYAGLAIIFFQEAVRLDPLDYKSHYNIAGTFLMMRLFPYALPHFEKAYEINSDDLSFLLDMGLCLENTGDHLKAICKCYLKAFNKNKKNIIVLRRIKNAFSSIGDKEGAKLAEDISFEIGT
jgi:tetratricopeptide (TPR) repeat protein